MCLRLHSTVFNSLFETFDRQRNQVRVKTLTHIFTVMNKDPLVELVLPADELREFLKHGGALRQALT